MRCLLKEKKTVWPEESRGGIIVVEYDVIFDFAVYGSCKVFRDSI